MHKSDCRSNIVLTTYPPIYPPCDCGYEEPEIQGTHHELCFPAIRDVRIGDWGPSCFTCEVLAICESRAYSKAYKTEELDLFAILLDRLGGSVTVTHEEIMNFNADRVWHRQENGDRSITIKVSE